MMYCRSVGQANIREALFMTDEEFLTVRELAELLRIGRDSAYELAASGAVPVLRWGRKIRIPKGALLASLNQRALQAQEQRHP